MEVDAEAAVRDRPPKALREPPFLTPPSHSTLTLDRNGGDDRRGYDQPPPERQDTKLKTVVLKLADDPVSAHRHKFKCMYADA